jgi:hypothetical protein
MSNAIKLPGVLEEDPGNHRIQAGFLGWHLCQKPSIASYRMTQAEP